jgi:hypothetical protein
MNSMRIHTFGFLDLGYCGASRLRIGSTVVGSVTEGYFCYYNIISNNYLYKICYTIQMSKTALLAGGCFWGEKSVGHFSQDHASFFANMMKQSSDMAEITWDVISEGCQLHSSDNLNSVCKMDCFCKKWKTVINASYKY